MTLARLARLSESASKLARAVAVLTPDARPAIAAALAGLEADETSDAVTTLLESDVVDPHALRDIGTLEFRHPIVRTAIYQDLAPGARSNAHRDAAALLQAEGAALDVVAAHLVRTAPIGAIGTVQVLRDAARRALGLGVPDTAATYLSRALDEDPERSVRADILLELGRAEHLAGRPAAVEHLDEVRRLADDPAIRTAAAIDQARILMYAAPVETIDRLDTALADLPESDQRLRLRAEAMRAILLMYDSAHVGALIEGLPAFTEVALGGQAGSSPLLALLAAWRSARAASREDVRTAIQLAERAWDGGRYLDESADLELLPQILGPFMIWDELDRLSEIIATMRGHAARTGSVMEHLMASGHDAFVETRRGNLDVVAVEMRAGFELAVELGQQFAAVSILWYCVDALLERPDLADLVAAVGSFELGPLARIYGGALFIATRGQLRFAAGDREGAVADLRHLQAVEGALGISNPYLPWPSLLASMLDVDEREEAVDLVQADLEQARRVGHGRRIGIDLGTLGTLVPDRTTALTYFEEAVAVLSGSAARLELARTLVEFGALHRRLGDRTAARERLGEGLALATRCGATVTAARARTELAAAGVRAKGDEAEDRHRLTPSELRVARMAGGGLTSRQIGQTLFVTTRTVESHLNHIYTKLGITSRKQLAEALSKNQ